MLTYGDEWASADCNANGEPDACDIAGETSCDANENGVPDECEIALAACEDIDEDACCDEGESLMGGGQGGGEGGGESMSGGDDTDGTPVPQDSGEGSESSGESESSSESESSESESSETESSETESPCAELTDAECWDLFCEWAVQQCWGPSCQASGFERFRAAQQKLAEPGSAPGSIGD